MYAQLGKIKYFPEVMGTTRVHEGGLWSSADKKTTTFIHVEPLSIYDRKL